MRFKAGISACSLFQSENQEEAIESLLRRFKKIVRAHPGLKGSFSKGKKRQVYLNFSAHEQDASPLVFRGKAPKLLSVTSPYEEILKTCEPYIVEKAFRLFGKRDRLAKLSILQIDEEHFLLMFSLSHLVGDGHTFYKIFNMLSSDTEIHSLQVLRRGEISTVAEIIPRENSRFMFHPRMIFWAFRCAFSWKKMRIRSFELNDDYVQLQKQAAKESTMVPFLSTNDILSSSYAQLCGSNALIMAVNFRGRISGINENDAGNYEELLVIDSVTSSQSQNIRLLVSDLAQQSKKISLPKGPAMAKSKPVLITNWAGFSRALMLEGAQELLHLPLYSSREITFDSCIVYRPHADRVAALLFMRDLDEAAVLAHPLFQKSKKTT
ncbi:MAG: hypothetical protein MK135_16130 [Polyangiaceae bacterium]|nr:hypothetical protein [Polyangiaceae bacterium]